MARPARPPLPAIVQAGHPVLRAVAEPVPPAAYGTRETRALVDLMVRTMRAAPGVGLAAPQIGIGQAIIVVEDRREYVRAMAADQREATQRQYVPLTVVLNPRLTVDPAAATATWREGCLSVRGYSAAVARALSVRVEGVDVEGAPIDLALTGWPARIFQHEVDHLGGTLYVDRMDSRTLAAEAP